MKRFERLATLLSVVLLAPGCDATASFSFDDDAAEAQDASTPTSQTVAVRNDPPESDAKPAKPPSEPEPEPPEAEKTTQGGPGPAMPFATPEVIERAKEIAGAAKTDWIPSAALEGPNSALALLHLAQTADDPKLAGAALKSLSGLYWARDHETRRKVDADYVAVVNRRLASDDPYILEGAFAAAQTAARVEPPAAELIETLVARAGGDQKPEARVLALDCLAGVKPLTAEIQQVFLHGLNDEDPAFVAQTLSEMKLYGNRFTKRDPLVAQLRSLASSEHAAVRGKALAALTNIDGGSEQTEATTQLALELLKDEHPLVRAEAVYALGVIRDVQYADEIVSVMGDDARARMRLDGWSNLDGSSADEYMLAPGGGTVTATALLSLAILSSATDNDFEYVDLIERKRIGHADHTKAVAAAKAWLKAHNEEK